MAIPVHTPPRTDLETLIEEGGRFVQALRPVWREVTRALPRGAGRKYFAFAVALVAVTVAGTFILGDMRRRQQR